MHDGSSVLLYKISPNQPTHDRTSVDPKSPSPTRLLFSCFSSRPDIIPSLTLGEGGGGGGGGKMRIKKKIFPPCFIIFFFHPFKRVDNGKKNWILFLSPSVGKESWKSRKKIAKRVTKIAKSRISPPPPRLNVSFHHSLALLSAISVMSLCTSA